MLKWISNGSGRDFVNGGRGSSEDGIYNGMATLHCRDQE